MTRMLLDAPPPVPRRARRPAEPDRAPRSAGDAGEAARPAGPRLGERMTWRTAGWIFAIWSAVLAFSYGAEAAARWMAESAPTDVGLEFLWGPFVDAAVWTAVTVTVFWLTRRFPLHRGRLLRNGAVLMMAGLALVPARNAVLVTIIRALGGMRTDVDFTYLFITTISQDLFVFWLTVLAIHSVRHARALQEREVARAQVESQLVQSQLQALKVQLQPHFLFNTLHAIATLVRDDPERAEQMIAALSDLLRTTLTHQRTQEVSLREEIGTLESYLQIEKTRLGERLRVEMDVPPEVREARLPHLLLQPLVENSIRHGISPRLRPGAVRIAARREDGRLHLSVDDDGCGFAGPPRQGAIGLANTQARLAQLYGDGASFHIDSAPDRGTRVRIQLPFRTAAEPLPAS